MEKNKRTCVFCNKTLKTMGFLRKNGKNHPDWESRDLHKKCWKLKMKQSKISTLA
jgi:hypothetical protein